MFNNFFKKTDKFPPKINIVTENKPGWVLRWIAESYAKRLPNAVVNTDLDPTADINFYVNYALFKEKTNIDIGYFTHRDLFGPTKKAFNNIARQVDWCIAMSDKTAKLLPKNKTTVNLIPPDPVFIKKNLVIGVVGTEKPTKRKRYEWAQEIQKIPGVEVLYTNGIYPWNKIPSFYKKIDYLLITSKVEGGPLPLVEAIAMGKPVITTDVGFVENYTTFKYSSLNELKKLIKGLVIKKDAWEKSTNALQKVFEKLYKEKRDKSQN